MDTLISVNVGLPRDVEWNGSTIRTSIWKSPVVGRAVVRRLNIEGDFQADLEGHGGEQRAVMVYQLASYRYWSERFSEMRFEHGIFGENLTVEGLEDNIVCIGDRYRIGSAVFEVSQPRVTCFKVGVRMRCAEMPALLVSHGRPGFYMRVIEEGEIGAGDAIVKISGDAERMTVAEVDALLYRASHPAAALDRALRIGALSPGWRASFEALRAALARGDSDGNPGLVSSQGGSVAWLGYRSLRVADVKDESQDVRSFEFAAPDGGDLPPFLPGQYIAARLQVTDGVPALTRLYSLSGPPGTASYRISVKRELRGVASNYLHSNVRVGTAIDVSAPRGNFRLNGGDRPVVLISAGVGVTPMIAMLHVLAHGDDPRQVWWIHGARDGLHHAFRDEASNLIARLPGARGYVAYSRPAATDRLGAGFDGTGHVSIDTCRILGVPIEGDFYLCGPRDFMAKLERELRESGVAGAQIHLETFGNHTQEAPGDPSALAVRQPPGPCGNGPRVNFARSGLSVRFADRFQSLLELAEACNVPVRWSCRTGVCQTCQTPLIDGAVSYRPDPLAPPATGTVLLCCAQPLADIALEL